MAGDSNMLFGKESLHSTFIRVAENEGCAGVDGVTIMRFNGGLDANLAVLAQEISNGTYQPFPLLRILVDKGNGEARPLSIPTVRDRVAQAAVLAVIEPVLEREFEDCSFGYRKGRSVKQVVQRVRLFHEDGYRFVADADIDAFFDSVDHDLLLGKLARYVSDETTLRLLGQWITAEYWDGESVKRLEKGIPQGSPISPVLANLFLDELDEAMIERGYRYVRYADDFLILCKSRKDAEKALEFTNEALARLNLVCDESEIADFERGFEFLGVTFVRSMALQPFDRPKRVRRVLYYPPPMNVAAWLLKKKRGW